MTDTFTVVEDGSPAVGGRPLISLHGSGVLYEMIRSGLDSRHDYSVAFSTPGTNGCAVHVVVGEDTDDVDAASVPWLPVRWEPGYVLLGPARLPGIPGCITCAEQRRRQNRPDLANYDAIRQQFGAELGAPGSQLRYNVTANLIADLTLTEATSLIHDPHSARTRNALLKLALTTARISWHRLLPDPLCSDCSTLPPDTPEAARIVLPCTRKPAPNTFRIRDALKSQSALDQLYTDSETGVIAQIKTGAVGGCAISVAKLEPAIAESTSQDGCGRALNFRSAKLSALTEALERYAGRIPSRARRTMVRARYVDIIGQAIDPATFGLFPDERHNLPGFPYRRYHPERELPWVWGYSFAREQPVLIPQNLAYYKRSFPPSEDDFVYDISSGCALGGCLTEAIFHGLLEITERDAFLLTWYARLPVPRIDIDSARDATIPLLAERARQTLGYDILAFDITLEHKVPSFWVLAVDCRPDSSRPAALCAANAHPIFEHALLGALCELSSLLGSLLTEYSGQDTAAAAARLLTDPDEVRTMKDHSLLYAHPDAFDRLTFLPIDGPARPLADFAHQWQWPTYSDLAEDLSELVGRYLNIGLDVIVVNQTSPEHHAGNLSCVKVLVPGTLPMTFGHRFRRTDGIPRLFSVPRQLGYYIQDISPEQINPYPHPFP